MKRFVVLLLLFLSIVAMNIGSIKPVRAPKMITFIGGASNSGSPTSTTVTYSSSGGNFIFVAIILGQCSVNSVVDSGGSTYSHLATAQITGVSDHLEIWGTTGRGSVASTSFTISTSSCTVNSAAAVSEYSGARNALGGVATNMGQSNNAVASLSFTLTAANNWLITGMNVINGSANLTANTGNLRETDSAPVGKGAIMDNTASSAISVTTSTNSNTSTFSSWVTAGVELRV